MKRRILYEDRNCLTFTALESGTFKFTSAEDSANRIRYSVNDGSTWITLPDNTDTPIIPAGTRVLWKGDGTGTQVGTFSSSGRFNVSGNILSIMNNIFDRSPRKLFARSKVVDASELTMPSGTLNLSVSHMFHGCTLLTGAPLLPFTNIVKDWCCEGFFYECTSLTNAPDLQAISISTGCYHNMFYGCTSLVNPPSVLPADTLQEECYHGMFYGCTSMSESPELPAKTLVYASYSEMFYNCSNLSKITCLATNTHNTEYTRNWVSGVKSTGTFIKAASMSSWPRGINGIPNNWSIQNKS